jgi:hypothetical protein
MVRGYSSMINIRGNDPPPAGTPGPKWAVDFNTCFTSIDAHDHSDGKGLQLSFDSVTFIDDFSVPVVTDANTFTFNIDSNSGSVASVLTDTIELYTLDGFGRRIKITDNGGLASSLNAGGGFTGDYVSSGAQLVYSNAPPTYAFFSDAGTTRANISCDGLSFPGGLTFDKVINISEFRVKCTTPTLSFNTGIAATHIITGDPITHQAVDLGPFVNLSSLNTAISQIGVFYTVPPPTQPFYSVFLGKTRVGYNDAGLIVATYSIKNFENRRGVNSPLNPPFGKYYLMGGVQQSVALLYFNDALVYSDQLELSQTGSADAFWSSGMVFTIRESN